MGQVTYDAAVIGTGPAGSSASFFLASKGSKVIVFDKSSLPRYKTCGGGVVSRVTHILPFDIDEVVEKKCFNAEVIDHRNYLSFSTHREKPIVLMTMRSSFDYYMLSKAAEQGITLCESCTVQKIEENSDYVLIHTDKGQFRARIIVAADGANGISSKYISPKRKIVKIPALEYEIYTGCEDYLRFSESARFDFEVAPHGYGWVFPKKDHLSVGIVSMGVRKSNLNNHFAA